MTLTTSAGHKPSSSPSHHDSSDQPAIAERPVSLLTSEGLLIEDERAPLSVTPELCRGLYRDMVLARRFDEEALALQRQGELGLWLMSLGQEAAQAGSIRAIRNTDHVFPTYREHVVAMCRGIQPAELLSQWRGLTHGSWDPARYRFHIYTLVLGAQTLHATGYAMGVRLDGSDEVVLCYLGDGASSQGDANEALNWSIVTTSPIIFFCQNNQWAISTPVAAQMGAPLHQRAAGFGLDSYLVDGNDVLAVYAVTAKAVKAVRDGGVPAFIEALTYRMAGHSTSDDPRKYRDPHELDVWRSRDPIERVRVLLDRQAWADENWLADIAVEAEDLAATARRVCIALPPPKLDETFLHTLVAETPLLTTEHQQFVDYMSSFTNHGSGEHHG